MQAAIKTLLVLAIIGALNWGLVGLFEWNLVQAIFTGDGAHEASAASRVVYILVGLAGLAAIFGLPTLGRHRTHRRAV